MWCHVMAAVPSTLVTSEDRTRTHIPEMEIQGKTTGAKPIEK